MQTKQAIDATDLEMLGPCRETPPLVGVLSFMAEAEDVPEAEYTEDVLAANIPLPLSVEKRDIDEIEVPGLARDPDEDETDATQMQAAAQLKQYELVVVIGTRKPVAMFGYR